MGSPCTFFLDGSYDRPLSDSDSRRLLSALDSLCSRYVYRYLGRSDDSVVVSSFCSDVVANAYMMFYSDSSISLSKLSLVIATWFSHFFSDSHDSVGFPFVCSLPYTSPRIHDSLHCRSYYRASHSSSLQDFMIRDVDVFSEDFIDGVRRLYSSGVDVRRILSSLRRSDFASRSDYDLFRSLLDSYGGLDGFFSQVVS